MAVIYENCKTSFSVFDLLLILCFEFFVYVGVNLETWFLLNTSVLCLEGIV